MRRPTYRPFGLRIFEILSCLVACACSAPASGEDRPQPAIEVHEWSVWVGSPSHATLNATRAYRNAMPGTVGTIRPKSEGKELEASFALAPASVIQFFGAPTRDIDIDLRVKKGTLLAHWPPGIERPSRVQWFKSDLTKSPSPDARIPFLPENHWLQGLRRIESALYHQRESRAERFLAYDSELALPVPVRLRGGPDEFTIQNLTAQKLVDVAVIAPTDAGHRVGWLDELPSGIPDAVAAANKEKEKEKSEPRKKKSERDQADDLFKKAEVEEKAAEKGKPKEEAKPLPPEGSADIRARVDQILNRPVTVNVESAPRKDVIDIVTRQARLRYELDDITIAKADVDLAKPTGLKAANVAARDALADVLGTVGLSYRVTEEGTLFITTAARLSEDSAGKNAVIEGPPMKLTLSKPLKAADPSYRELTRDSYSRRLARQGLREEAIQTLLGRHAEALFAPAELIVLVHYSRDAIDEAVSLDVFPSPKTFVRTAVLVVHGIDPRLQDRARELVKKLGDERPGARDAAEVQLFGLGPVAVPALEDALREKDIEIVFRAERLLLRLNRQVP